MTTTTRLLSISLLTLGLSANLLGQARRSLEIADLFQLRNVGSPSISPDGEWVAYTVSRIDIDTDRRDVDIYMSSLTDPAADAVRLTTSDESETSPRWSPTRPSGRRGRCPPRPPAT